MTAQWGSLTDILARLEAMDEDMRDIAEDIDTTIGSAKAERMCEHARAAIGFVRALVEVERGKFGVGS